MAAISLKINILDKEYQVNCKPEEREALEYSAQLLNEKMDEIRQGSHIIGLERIAVMAALNLAHDLIRSQDSVKQDAGAANMLQSMDLKLDSVLSDLTKSQ
ncbi:MAG: cell division protein ZapA [Porticoccaceae bacterium]|jgi:cell division protein ZapA|nr:cell division protein ZapA [Porticoccaceae bacterium]